MVTPNRRSLSGVSGQEPRCSWCCWGQDFSECQLASAQGALGCQYRGKDRPCLGVDPLPVLVRKEERKRGGSGWDGVTVGGRGVGREARPRSTALLHCTGLN